MNRDNLTTLPNIFTRCLLKEEPAKKQQAQHKDHRIDYYFDKTHLSSILVKKQQLPVILARSNIILRRLSMSKIGRPILSVTLIILSILCIPTGADGQDMTAEITIGAGGAGNVRVEGSFNGQHGPSEIRFMDRFGSADGLAERFSDVTTADSEGRPIPGGNSGRGQIRRWTYRADLSPRKDRFSAAHVSWSDTTRAVLMLDDLLPKSAVLHRSAKIKINVPDGWTVVTSEKSVGGNSYDVADIEKAVFFAGAANTASTAKAARTDVSVMLAGEWPFTASEAAEMAAEIYSHYARVFGGIPSERVQIAFLPFPEVVEKGEWEAGSRGSTITIVSSDMPFRSQSRQRLHEQLRHEIFHLWIPNGVNLTGNYDWFYEGFALYQSLKVAVAANRIRFDDMLDTLSRAYSIGGRNVRSGLVTLSKDRWSGSNTQVYARGMLAAFLSDLALLDASGGRRSTDQLLRPLYLNNRSQSAQNGNDAVLELMRSFPELRPVASSVIDSGDAVDWADAIAAAGLEYTAGGGTARLKVTNKLSGQQRRILDKLGYNNWRRMPVNNR